MRTAVDVLGVVTAVAFSALAVATTLTWRARRSRPAGWAAATFGVLALVAIVGQFFPEDPEGRTWMVALEALLAVLVLFPYLLFRFAVAFRPASRGVEALAAGLTGIVVVWGFFLPEIPGPGEPRPAAFNAYVAGLVVQWTYLFVVVATRLWRAGRGQPTLTRRRMRILACAAAGMALVIIASGAAPSDAEPGWRQLVTQLGTLVTAGLFFVGFATPRALRIAWRQPEQQAFQSAIAHLMTATTRDEVAAVLLPHTARIMGARAVALLDRGARVVDTWGIERGEAERALLDPSERPVTVELKTGAIAVWTSPYTPFFGNEELDLLHAFGVLADLAMERTVLFARERAFIANAAHELRTPLAALTGLSATLASRWKDLSDEQVTQLLEAMDRQGTRAAGLVDRMLDLAFIEHSGIALENVVLSGAAKRALDAAPPPEGTTVVVDIDGELSGRAETERLEQVLINLLTNAYRYGGPNVRIEGRALDGWVQLVVADDGPGVADQVAADIFEPFMRATSTGATGTGLGLAIAKRLVEAFGGSIDYEHASPRGARFVIRLREST